MQPYRMIAAFLVLLTTADLFAQPPPARPPNLEQQFEQVDPALIADEARQRGDASRGALVYFKSPAGCVACHQNGEQRSPLGPDLTRLGKTITDIHLVEALLHPSKSIREDYGTVQVLTIDGEIFSGMFVREDDQTLVLRDAAKLQSEITIAKDDIEVRSEGKLSMMPDGLVATLKSEREFLDLLSYLFAIQDGGPAAAEVLKPSREQLVVQDDTANLNHSRILRKAEDGNQKRGRQIYEASCVQCHGADGNTPSLATSRAFGKQKLKYGADPHSMFKTLSTGNGLMAAATALSPRERYEVIAYIRNRFMKDSNPDYQPITDDYLKTLPTGTDMGDAKLDDDRDYGPALASQLGREVNSALTIKLGDTSIAYDLHSMNQAGLWSDGFLDVDRTQHKRGRGEGYTEPKGTPIDGLSMWKWGHDGVIDYPTDHVLPRGPLPEKWFDYHGHYLYGNRIVLSYKIDGRDILEVPTSLQNQSAIRHTLRIGDGELLVLAVGDGGSTASKPKITGDIDGITCALDDKQRWVVRIPADDHSRLIDIVRFAEDAQDNQVNAEELSLTAIDPGEMMGGEDLRWPEILETVGYRGFQDSAYAVDTISVPESTPWNTWFRTSAIDFFPDGRLAVATVGGDVWIVSGVDDDLLNIRWKRFAGGMYEPFGIKVVDGLIYVTCKDRLTRLHDLNDDGEADFYESFSADTDVSTFFHAFNFDLQTDSKGNFYYAKSGQYTDYRLPGAIIKLSPDGKSRSVVCTGLRTPNGMGILPDDRLTVSDNQGTWMPASKVNLVKPGGFYGYVQNKKGGAWAPDGGRIDTKKVVLPETFDPPLIWMPQEVDNSSGGQVYVDDDRWGPLAGRLLHTSFGQGHLFYLMQQNIKGVDQAALIKFPHDFGTGIMRGRVNAFDGQVYVTGLNGWNDNGRVGLADNGIYRVRYTDKPLRMITDCQVEPDGLRLEFNFQLDPTSAADIASYVAQQWNYKWTGNYGSGNYHPVTGEPGKQSVVVSDIQLSEDRKTVHLHIPELQPVHQLHLQLNVNDSSGDPFSETIYWTVHRVPAK